MIKPDQIEVSQDLPQTEVITQTLRLLRKIRGFPESLYIGDPDYTPAQRRQFFLDAEQIGSACANYLVVFSKTSMVEDKVAWFRVMTEVSSKYSGFKEITARQSPLEEASERVGRALYSLSVLAPTIADSSTQMEFERRFQSLGENELLLKDLCDNKMTIFSPLATDYLIASMLHRFTEIYFTPDCFRLRPIILDRYLRPAVTSDFIEGQGWLEGAEGVAVFVENYTSGDTLRATWRAVPIPLLSPD